MGLFDCLVKTFQQNLTLSKYYNLKKLLIIFTKHVHVKKTYIMN